ncbi:MAG: hypothetical protein HGGPFJEG_00240 [Ignavibacteria bacterium]|nr:hypothetical protein [Ignavibacteria bacterium]
MLYLQKKIIMKRICLWSGPRNISTALMYSFAQRNDTRVFDEPLYAHYLAVTGADHPGKDEVLKSMDNDGMSVIRNVILAEYQDEVVFFKQMAHHLIMIDDSFLKDVVNLILIRNPKQIIASFRKVIPEFSIHDIGIKKQFEIYQNLISMNLNPLIIDSGEILKNPERMLTKLCDNLGISFDKKMLSWNAGPKKEDGVWAKYWYENVHKSTGFGIHKQDETEIPENLYSLYNECRQYYEKLYEKSLKL